jgi:IS1 family transposase
VLGVKRQVVEMAINGTGIRDTGRVLGINKNTVISLAASGGMDVRPEAFFEAEMDERWFYVGKKSEQRWLWYAIDHATSMILAYVFGKHKDEVFKQLKVLFQPSFNIACYYTDDWGAYERHLDISKHEVGKCNTQKIERKNLNLRTWIKAFDKGNHLFFQVSFDARYCHWIAYQ